MQPPLSSVCVYCGSSFGANPLYRETAEALGRMLAQAGVRLVYGGGSVGLMGVTAAACLDAGGRVTGIIPEFLDRLEVGMTGLTEMIKTENMHQRKERMAELSDGFVVLPGGLGTLDETFEILTWRQLHLHSKPIVLLNVGGYWDHFVHLLEHQAAEGFVKPQHLELFQVVESVADVLPALAAHPADSPEVRSKWT
ncbi:MAG: TIGR00730 family Rossman fold protein [Alphaproteobacteria bacterium]|nr:TIGR00730 family Rossman fold protein [Alphaproteobacteria bacterium]